MEMFEESKKIFEDKEKKFAMSKEFEEEKKGNSHSSGPHQRRGLADEGLVYLSDEMNDESDGEKVSTEKPGNA
jgi:hypothetical protein